MTFAEEILNEKPVICFDKLLFIRSQIEKAEIENKDWLNSK